MDRIRRRTPQNGDRKNPALPPARGKRLKPARGAATSKSQRRREDILQKALELFDRQGYANTSLDDIARAVGIAREGIYYYFKNRAEILLHIIEPRSLALIEGLAAIVDRAGADYAQKLHDAIRNHLEQFDLHCLEMTVSLRDGHLEDAKAVRASMTRIWKQYEALWTRLIAEGQKAGAFKLAGDPKMLAFGILGMCNWLARWYDPKKGVPIADLVESYTSMVGGGLVK
ncbi:MAG: TetR family transcriptional regulator [Rhodospirillaceae bacterium]|nr:TetR family transcriptional regulator [Rhodospirillaceae bacterium]